MGRKINFSVLATVTVALLSSCTNNDVYDPSKEGDLKKAQYEEAFINKYGTISPVQDWGFGENLTTRGANTNSNQWKDFTEVPRLLHQQKKKRLLSGLKQIRTLHPSPLIGRTSLCSM